MSSALELIQDYSRPGRQERLRQAEAILLSIADHIYTKTSLKPMSKTLFLVSRALLVVSQRVGIRSVSELVSAYRSLCKGLGDASPSDDYSLADIAEQAAAHLPILLERLERVRDLSAGNDALGLAFDTLLRGKWESGEGLGTFLTPEEVVRPMVRMALAASSASIAAPVRHGAHEQLFGDICGGTGRFVFHLAKEFERRGVSQADIEARARLYDQSCMAVDLGKLNFVIEGLRPSFHCVRDSLTDSTISNLDGKFAILATNPPFGAGKYGWSADLSRSMRPEVLRSIGITGRNSSADPALLFVFRNLDLLTPEGVLAIVLPDGIVHSASFRSALEQYEVATGRYIDVVAIVSLPSATFTLGGTVAKTSFAIIRRTDSCESAPVYFATAKHIGFKKRGNRRVADAAGNDLDTIADEFASGNILLGHVAANWREHERLSPAALARSQRHAEDFPHTLGDVAVQLRAYSDHIAGNGHYHISILDVDETGLIDIVAASRNNPVTKSLSCQAGDILISCLNPRIWRVTVVPSVPGQWTCSAEFAVFRPKHLEDSWRLFVSLQHSSVRAQVERMAGGTSSSRQRVPKQDLARVHLPKVSAIPQALEHLSTSREMYYATRLREAQAIAALHRGADTLEL